jgi:hypothetical protein
MSSAVFIVFSLESGPIAGRDETADKTSKPFIDR